MKLKTKYNVGDKVTLVGLDNEKSVVRAIYKGYIGYFGATYECCWFHNGHKNTDYFREEELLPRGIK